MSERRTDQNGRWRNKVVAFRMSLEEDEQLEQLVRLSGLSKQDYIIQRLLCREIKVYPNPRVYKALKQQIGELGQILREKEGISEETQDLLQLIVTMVGEIKGVDRNA